MTGGFWSRSTLTHARKRVPDDATARVPLCGARTTRMTDDDKVTCSHCKRLLAQRVSAKATNQEAKEKD
jgi:hypothetical protein